MSTPEIAAEAEAIRAARAAQTAALAAGDYASVERFWTDDVTIRRALGHALTGAREARRALASVDGGGPHIVYQRRAVAVEVSANWPLAFEDGVWSGHVASAAAPAIISGRYAAQWVKRDGRWLIRAEVFVALDADGPGRGLQALE